jgi:hypothetical protein
VSRRWLRRALVEECGDRPDDVTVLIGVRNRTDHRLINALRSIREQTHSRELVRILVVDYGSEPAAAAFVADTCRAHGADYLYVEEGGVWARSRCLNVGLRRVETTFVLTSDVDILLSPEYVARAVRALRSEPLSLVGSAMLDLPEESAAEVRAAVSEPGPLPLAAWKERGSPRMDREIHPSILMTYTAVHHLVRGYAEYFELWGGEDVDLLRRLERLGLRPRVVGPPAFYLHQWHPKYEGVPEDGRDAVIRRNHDYPARHDSIVRNGPEWGLGRVRAGG